MTSTLLDFPHAWRKWSGGVYSHFWGVYWKAQTCMKMNYCWKTFGAFWWLKCLCKRINVTQLTAVTAVCLIFWCFFSNFSKTSNCRAAWTPTLPNQNATFEGVKFPPLFLVLQPWLQGLRVLFTRDGVLAFHTCSLHPRHKYMYNPFPLLFFCLTAFVKAGLTVNSFGSALHQDVFRHSAERESFLGHSVKVKNWFYSWNDCMAMQKKNN